LVGAVKVAVPPPPFAVTLKAPFGAEVTVWFWESSFLTVIFAPGATDAGTVYLKSLIVMMTGFPAGVLGAAEGDVDMSGAIDDDEVGAEPEAAEPSGPEDPHPVNATASPATAMLINPSFILMMCPSPDV